MDNKLQQKVTPPSGGMLSDIAFRLKLIGRLMLDRRVNFFAKIIPLAGLVYLFYPFDLAPMITLPFIGAVDDAAILWFSSYFFLEFCPQEVVDEHTRKLTGGDQKAKTEVEVIDANAEDIES